MTIEKTTIELYKIRVDGEFADISIDEGNECGRVQIASSYGKWSNFWGSCGTSFKDFLCDVDCQYFARKVSEDSWFDLDATIKQLSSRMKEYTDGQPKLKREIAEEIRTLADCSDRQEFSVAISHCPKIMKMEEFVPHLAEDISPTFKKFWTKIWVPFCEELKKELAHSKNSVSLH